MATFLFSLLVLNATSSLGINRPEKPAGVLRGKRATTQSGTSTPQRSSDPIVAPSKPNAINRKDEGVAN